MKSLFLIIGMAGVAFSQGVTSKVEVKDPISAPSERPLTSDELLKLQLTQARIQNLQTKYKLAEYQTEVQSFATEQQAIYVAACKSIGLSDANIKAGECRLDTGVDSDGKPTMGPDGKPLAPRVWREVAKETK